METKLSPEERARVEAAARDNYGEYRLGMKEVGRKPIPAEVLAAIRNTNLAYLFGLTEAFERELKEPREFSLHDGCILRSAGTLPVGTKVWAFRHPRITYSAYRRIGDEDYPARGADILSTGSDWTLITIVDGKPADAYVATEPTEPRVIGRVE